MFLEGSYLFMQPVVKRGDSHERYAESEALHVVDDVPERDDVIGEVVGMLGQRRIR